MGTRRQGCTAARSPLLPEPLQMRLQHRHARGTRSRSVLLGRHVDIWEPALLGSLRRASSVNCGTSQPSSPALGRRATVSPASRVSAAAPLFTAGRRCTDGRGEPAPAQSACRPNTDSYRREIRRTRSRWIVQRLLHPMRDGDDTVLTACRPHCLPASMAAGLASTELGGARGAAESAGAWRSGARSLSAESKRDLVQCGVNIVDLQDASAYMRTT